MKVFLDRVDTLLSGSMVVSESPNDDKDYGRDGTGRWVDVNGIRPIGEVSNAPVALFDFNDDEWVARTGNYSGLDVLGVALSNTPYAVVAATTYSYIVETISGVEGTKQQVTVLSRDWEGERFFIRTSPGGVDITDSVWKEVATFFPEVAKISTVNNSFATAITHPLADDTFEALRFFVNGRETAGTDRGFFEVVVAAENVAGTTSIIGSTILVAHKTLGTTNVNVTVDGAENVLLQVRGSNANWDWKVEGQFNEVIF